MCLNVAWCCVIPQLLNFGIEYDLRLAAFQRILKSMCKTESHECLQTRGVDYKMDSYIIKTFIQFVKHGLHIEEGVTTDRMALVSRYVNTVHLSLLCLN